MDTTDTISILILAAIALIGGYLTARTANSREPVQSGGVASASNYLASAVLTALAPTVLCTMFFIRPTFLGEEIRVPVLGWKVTEFTHAIVVALSMIALALIFSLIYAILEKPSLDKLANQEDKGWTREDAETSGL